mgnify:CR=1 FL=1
MKYVGDRKILSKKCKPCKNTMQGQVLGQRLLKILEEDGNGVGLAANQVGVDAAVCVVKVDKPYIFINPRITGRFGKSLYQEACLSFPGDYILTERWTNIVVTADNHRKSIVFSFDKNPLECVCVQHEIDHLNGVTMFDRQVKMETNNG